jgi:hypothetical protein
MKFVNYFLLIIFVFFVISCDGGLEPLPLNQKTMLNGTIKYIKGKDYWPPIDSVIAVRVVAFKKLPDSSIIGEIINGNAYFTPDPLPMNVDSSNFSFEIKDAPVNLVYIAVVQQLDSIITSQKVIGIYSITGDKTKPSQLSVEKGKTLNINIDVDFDNLPPMPF